MANLNEEAAMAMYHDQRLRRKLTRQWHELSQHERENLIAMAATAIAHDRWTQPVVKGGGGLDEAQQIARRWTAIAFAVTLAVIWATVR
jgi:hypothetical protein